MPIRTGRNLWKCEWLPLIMEQAVKLSEIFLRLISDSWAAKTVAVVFVCGQCHTAIAYEPDLKWYNREAKIQSDLSNQSAFLRMDAQTLMRTLLSMQSEMTAQACTTLFRRLLIILRVCRPEKANRCPCLRLCC